MNTKEWFDCPMIDRDTGATTVGQYLQTLLATLVRMGEGFNSKRPFGNSGWDWDIAHALISAGVVEGTLDDCGFIESFDEEQFIDDLEQVVFSMIVP